MGTAWVAVSAEILERLLRLPQGMEIAGPICCCVGVDTATGRKALAGGEGGWAMKTVPKKCCGTCEWGVLAGNDVMNCCYPLPHHHPDAWPEYQSPMPANRARDCNCWEKKP